MARNRLRRLLRLSLLLQQGSRVNCRDLARIMNVSRRTIYRDMRALGEAGLDVVFDHTNGHYVVRGTRLKGGP